MAAFFFYYYFPSEILMHDNLSKIAEYNISRNKAAGGAAIIGVLMGLLNMVFMPIDFALTPSFFGWLVAAIIITTALHEGTHAIVAVILQHKPEFGLKPPLIYITFNEKIPAKHFLIIALSPFAFLNFLFISGFLSGQLKVLCFLCFLINCLGSLGDIWIFFKLFPPIPGALIQDTKTGVQLWLPSTATKVSEPPPALKKDE
ncbi:DUF3267 domain-containing protein [Candidatus Riflebacteria bacterium]